MSLYFALGKFNRFKKHIALFHNTQHLQCLSQQNLFFRLNLLPNRELAYGKSLQHCNLRHHPGFAEYNSLSVYDDVLFTIYDGSRLLPFHKLNPDGVRHHPLYLYRNHVGILFQSVSYITGVGAYKDISSGLAVSHDKNFLIGIIIVPLNFKFAYIKERGFNHKHRCTAEKQKNPQLYNEFYSSFFSLNRPFFFQLFHPAV